MQLRIKIIKAVLFSCLELPLIFVSALLKWELVKFPLSAFIPFPYQASVSFVALFLLMVKLGGQFTIYSVFAEEFYYLLRIFFQLQPS